MARSKAVYQVTFTVTDRNSVEETGTPAYTPKTLISLLKAELPILLDTEGEGLVKISPVKVVDHVG